MPGILCYLQNHFPMFPFPKIHFLTLTLTISHLLLKPTYLLKFLPNSFNPKHQINAFHQCFQYVGILLPSDRLMKALFPKIRLRKMEITPFTSKRTVGIILSKSSMSLNPEKISNQHTTLSEDVALPARRPKMLRVALCMPIPM